MLCKLCLGTQISRMWNNNNRKNSPNWRGRGNKFGNNSRSGSRTFQRRKTPDRMRPMSKRDRVGGQFNEDKNLRYLDENQRDRRAIYDDETPAVERKSRLLCDNRIDRLNSDRDVNENSRRDAFRTDNERFNCADIYNRDMGNRNQDQFIDRKDEFVGLDQDMAFGSDRSLDNRHYKMDDYNREIDLKYDNYNRDIDLKFEESFSGNIHDTGTDSALDWQFRDGTPIGEADRWKSGNSSLLQDGFSGELLGYDNQSVDRKVYDNIGEGRYSYEMNDDVKTEFHMDHLQLCTGIKPSVHDLSEDHFRTTSNISRENRDRNTSRIHNRKHVSNSSKYVSRRNDSVPYKLENSRHIHGPKVGARSVKQHDTNIRLHETGVKRHVNELGRPIKHEMKRRSDHLSRSCSSSTSKDSHSDSRSSAKNSKDVKHAKDDSRDKVAKPRNNRSKSNSNKEPEKSSSKNNQNKPDSHSRTGLNSNRPRSGSREDNKRRLSNRSTPDSKRSSRAVANTDGFKKPIDRQQSNTTNRSNSSRRIESESGHYEDDILSIMADDDAFDTEHKSGNATSNSVISRKHSRESNSRDNRSSSLRDKHDQGFRRQNSEKEADRSKEPVFEIHAESSASIFSDSVDRPGRYRNVEKSDGTRSSFSSDHSRVKRTGKLNMEKSDVSKSEDRRRHRSNRYADKGPGWYQKNNRGLTTERKYGHVRDKFGKTGAVLREDRQDTDKNKTGVRTYNSKSKVQNFRAGARVGSRLVDSKFKSKNSYTDRVKRKYFRGGFKGFSNDWDFSMSKGNHNQRQSRGGMDRGKRVDDRNERAKKRNDKSDNRNDGFDNVNVDVTIKDDKVFNDFPLNVDQEVNSKQQIVFIPNQDISGGLPPLVDQFGHIVYNDLSEQAIEGQIPVQFVPEQYPADGTAVGEQLVFIPFVNQMTNYPENMPNPLNNPSSEEVKDGHDIPVKRPQQRKKKPLSKVARAVLRKKLEAKRKKRMEEEIERRLLKKLFGTSGAVQVIEGEQSSQVKKKPVIKRISPPSGNKPSHLHKTVKLVKKTDDVIDISDEEEFNQYDSVSDLEDISDDEEYDNRRDKRPVFRKPGEPRKTNRRLIGNRAGNSDEDDHKRQDVRRVVQSSINQNIRHIGNMHGQKRQRSSYEEEPDPDTFDTSARVGSKKNRRSISPIEITVSNERYSKVPSSRRRGPEDCKDGHKNRDGQSVRRENSSEKFSHSFGDQKYGREIPVRGQNERGGHRHQERNDVKRLDGSRSREEDSAHKFDTRRNTHNSHKNFEASQMSDDRKLFGYGKYKDRNVDDSKSDQGRNTVSKYGNERDNIYRSDKQSEWENCNFDRRIGNLKNDADSRQFDRIGDVEMNRSPTLDSHSHFSKKPFPGTHQTSPSFTQQPIEGHSFSQSISTPPQFSKHGPGVDHSLPPVQNAPVTMPPFPPTSLVRPDMSLPPPVGSIGNNSHLMQASNSGNFQQNFGIQSQHFQPLHQQYPQQQQQVLQHGQSQFQMQQPVYSSSIGQNQMGLQHVQPNQFQQTQSNVGIVPVNQNLMSDHMTQQITTRGPQLNQGNYKQVIKTSHNQQAFVTTNSQGVRGVIGTLKTSGSSSAPGLRVAQVDSGSAVRNVKQSPTSNMGRLPEDDDAYFDDLVQMVCSKCNCVLLDHGLMKAHGRWHDMIESNNKKWRCDQCEQGYLSSAAYSEHMDSKHTYNSWNCSLCNLSFSFSSGLNKHIRHSTHKNLKVKFVCSLCPASFMVLTHLIQHKKENHQSNSVYSGFKKF